MNIGAERGWRQVENSRMQAIASVRFFYWVIQVQPHQKSSACLPYYYLGNSSDTLQYSTTIMNKLLVNILFIRWSCIAPSWELMVFKRNHKLTLISLCIFATFLWKPRTQVTQISFSLFSKWVWSLSSLQLWLSSYCLSSLHLSIYFPSIPSSLRPQFSPGGRCAHKNYAYAISCTWTGICKREKCENLKHFSDKAHTQISKGSWGWYNEEINKT